jgi:hypothetical protein
MIRLLEFLWFYEDMKCAFWGLGVKEATKYYDRGFLKKE